VKLFVTASAEVRAMRRFRELVAAGEDVSPDEILADVRARDERDMTRAAAPLKPAEDAVTLDTSDMDIDTALAAAIQLIEARKPARL
ncbi:d(CMP) kinase, partial [Cribrihabitans sp. XS_ASV171]